MDQIPRGNGYTDESSSCSLYEKCMASFDDVTKAAMEIKTKYDVLKEKIKGAYNVPNLAILPFINSIDADAANAIQEIISLMNTLEELQESLITITTELDRVYRVLSTNHRHPDLLTALVNSSKASKDLVVMKNMLEEYLKDYQDCRTKIARSKQDFRRTQIARSQR